MDPTDSTDSDGQSDTDDSHEASDAGAVPDASVPTDAEQACFEAGIKFGSLYHQFAGTPVSPASADALSRAMETAIENQPHCEQVTVDIDTGALEAEIAGGSASYTELTGRFMDVTIHVEHAGCDVVTEMAMEDGYPLMSISNIDRGSS
jgi:hypothetical protein